MMQLLDALQAAIGQQTVQARRFSELLRIMIDAADLGDIPHALDEAAVGDAQRIRLDGVRAVFVVGVNDGVFPSPPADGGIFTQAEKAQLRDAALQLGETTENACAEERLLVYSVLTAASEKLFVSYSLSDLHAKTQHKSEIITALEKIYPFCKHIDTASLTGMQKIASVQTAFEAAAVQYNENTPFGASLKAYIAEKSDYADRLKAVNRAAAGRGFSFHNDENAKALFGTEQYLSASKIELYHKCSFAYFCRYGLGLEPVATAKLDASHRGLLIHHVLEKLLLQYPNGAIASVSSEELKESLHSLCGEYVLQYMGGSENMPPRLVWQLERAEQTAFEIAERLRTEFGTSLFVTRDVELAIRQDSEVAPYVITLPDGGTVTVTGVVDRVDVMELDGRSYVRIVDYKTGGKNFKLSDLDAGLNMQMLLYLMCLWDNAEARYGDIVPAGILYVPAKTGAVNLPRNATLEEIEQAKVKNGRMNGLVLADKNVILGMDSTGSGVYINAKIDKKGEIKGSVASFAEFEKIHEKIESLLCAMYTDLRSGTIAAVPVEGSNYKDICRYCAYAAVCGHENGDCVKNIEMQREDAAHELDT